MISERRLPGRNNPRAVEYNADSFGYELKDQGDDLDLVPLFGNTPEALVYFRTRSGNVYRITSETQRERMFLHVANLRRSEHKQRLMETVYTPFIDAYASVGHIFLYGSGENINTTPITEILVTGLDETVPPSREANTLAMEFNEMLEALPPQLL